MKSMQKIEIRELSKDHLTEAFDLLTAYPDTFTDSEFKVFSKDLRYYFLFAQQRDNEEKDPLQPRRKEAAYGAFIEEELVGLVFYQKVESSPFYVELKWLAIKKGFQGRGIGRVLVNETLLKVKQFGFRRAYLFTSNESYNDGAKLFYQKLGFEGLAVLPGFFRMEDKPDSPEEESLLFYKPL
jgi:ribosomal protein S18 acetylase RimI-like enzyme